MELGFSAPDQFDLLANRLAHGHLSKQLEVERTGNHLLVDRGIMLLGLFILHQLRLIEVLAIWSLQSVAEVAFAVDVSALLYITPLSWLM